MSEQGEWTDRISTTAADEMLVRCWVMFLHLFLGSLFNWLVYPAMGLPDSETDDFWPGYRRLRQRLATAR